MKSLEQTNGNVVKTSLFIFLMLNTPCVNICQFPWHSYRTFHYSWCFGNANDSIFEYFFVDLKGGMRFCEISRLFYYLKYWHMEYVLTTKFHLHCCLFIFFGENVCGLNMKNLQLKQMVEFCYENCWIFNPIWLKIHICAIFVFENWDWDWITSKLFHNIWKLICLIFNN